eukprot:2660255-Alexandrium_andersonii.AAC.1
MVLRQMNSSAPTRLERFPARPLLRPPGGATALPDPPRKAPPARAGGAFRGCLLYTSPSPRD